MDYMKIENGVISAMISLFVEKELRKKFGTNVGFNLYELSARNENGKTKMRVSFDMTCSTDKLPDILKSLGDTK